MINDLDKKKKKCNDAWINRGPRGSKNDNDNVNANATYHVANTIIIVKIQFKKRDSVVPNSNWNFVQVCPYILENPIVLIPIIKG